MPATTPLLKTLGDFLHARRADVSPSTLPAHAVVPGAVCRVPGPKREGVAQVTTVSIDYYTRVKQGRLAPTPQVLAALARVLRLTPEQTAYAEDLLQRARGYAAPSPGHEAADGRLQLVLGQLTELPALVGRLSIADDAFRRWGAGHRIHEQDFGAKVLIHPTAGRLRLNRDSFTYPGAARQQLVPWSADPETEDARSLRELGRSVDTANHLRHVLPSETPFRGAEPASAVRSRPTPAR